MNNGNLVCLVAAVAITGGTVGALATPAQAATRPIVVTTTDVIARHISYADLNLASASGEKTLNTRVRGAVTGLCNDATELIVGDRTYNTENSRCRNGAWSQAKPQMSRAVQRAHEIALTGTSTLAAVAITIAIPQ